MKAKFWEKLALSETTSCIKYLHSSIWSQFLPKNKNHTIYSRSSEASFSSAIFNLNEHKRVFLRIINSVPEFSYWPVSEKNTGILIKFSEKRLALTRQNDFKQKEIKFLCIKMKSSTLTAKNYCINKQAQKRWLSGIKRYF